MPVLSAIDPGAPERGGLLTRLDIRIKLLIMAACSVMAIVFKSASALGVLLVASLVYVGLLRRFKIVAAAYGFVAIMIATAIACAQVIAVWVPAVGGFELGVFIFPFLRLLVMLNTVLVIALSSRLQTMLAALKAMHLPYYIYLPSAVMLRFIPSFINDAQQIKDSLKTKGYPLTPMRVVARPLFTLRLLFVPLVIRALRTSEELGVAAELKGAGCGANITAGRAKRLAPLDWMASAAAGLWFLFAAAVEYGAI